MHLSGQLHATAVLQTEPAPRYTLAERAASGPGLDWRLGRNKSHCRISTHVTPDVQPVAKPLHLCTKCKWEVNFTLRPLFSTR